MADYNKSTVAQLRQLLKERGIPSTGLTKKAQIVAKLEESDSASTEAPEDAAEESEQAEAPVAQEVAVPEVPLAEAGGKSEALVGRLRVLTRLQNLNFRQLKQRQQ